MVFSGGFHGTSPLCTNGSAGYLVTKFHSWNYRNLHGLTFVNGLKLEVPLLLA